MTPFDEQAASPAELREEADEITDVIAGLVRMVDRGHIGTLAPASGVMGMLLHRHQRLLDIARMKECKPEPRVNA